jgi:sugar lactone lactonase YvrE
LARALAKDPLERSGTGQEFVSAARSALGLDPRPLPRRRALALAAAGVGATAAAVFVLALVRDGGPRSAATGAGVISTLAGSREVTPNDGRPAQWAIAVGPDGLLYVAGSDAVERIDRSGTVTTVAGTGVYGYSGDGGPATRARIAGDIDLAFDGEGRLHILQTYRPALRRVDEHGVIDTIAGTGTIGFLGDGPRTLSRDLCGAPVGPAFDRAGRIYVICYKAHRVIRIERDGSYRTVAGSDAAGYAGDGGPATAAQLNRPSGIAIDRDGNLYIADTLNHRVRKVDAAGIITTVAGTGRPGLSRDGWRATAVDLWQPSSVAVDAGGTLYIVEAATHRVRKVDTSGIITTVAGTGVRGFGRDGGPGSDAALNTPEEVAVDGAGNVYISDRGNQRIRVVRP